MTNQSHTFLAGVQVGVGALWMEHRGSSLGAEWGGRSNVVNRYHSGLIETTEISLFVQTLLSSLWPCNQGHLIYLILIGLFSAHYWKYESVDSEYFLPVMTRYYRWLCLRFFPLCNELCCLALLIQSNNCYICMFYSICNF